jgi:hypothetical protein
MYHPIAIDDRRSHWICNFDAEPEVGADVLDSLKRESFDGIKAHHIDEDGENHRLETRF